MVWSESGERQRDGDRAPRTRDRATGTRDQATTEIKERPEVERAPLKQIFNFVLHIHQINLY